MRRLCHTRKVGHAGTLDPMATGVLLVGVNRATRLLGHLALHDKRYLATIRLGVATTTDDAEGEVTQVRSALGLSQDQICDQIAVLTGEIMQVPTSVSAIKVNGERAYKLVRAGEQVELAARPVTVSRFDLCEFIDLDVDVECSSGTYIRALARDLGAALEVGGHLTALRRTRIGSFDLDLPHIGWDEFTDDTTVPVILPMGDVARQCFPVVTLNADFAARVKFGHTLPLEVETSDGATIGVLNDAGELLALYRKDEHVIRPMAVLV